MRDAADVVTLPAEDFLDRVIRRNAWIDGHRSLFDRWFDTPVDREEAARSEGIALGVLLRTFNGTAPLEPPLGYAFRRVPFEVIGMAGACDDIHGDRFPRFGEPRTLRCYLADPSVVPQRVCEAADWNFMDAGREGFVGYAYGVQHDRTLYLAGIQSDLAVRYGYLLQRGHGATEVRDGDAVTERVPDDLIAEYGACVPALRRSFQRWWVPILLAGICTWLSAPGRPSELAFMDFDLSPSERQRGHVLWRLYRDLPRKLGACQRTVSVGADRYQFRVVTVVSMHEWLGAAWQR